MATNNTQTTTATTIAGAAVIGGIVYGRINHLSIISTFGVAVVFGFVAYFGVSAVEENFK